MKTKNKNIITSNDQCYEDMYICMHNAKEKRKHVLTGIKNSLVMQEDLEKIVEIRKNKAQIQGEIKRSLDKISNTYQELKKEMPNVKNIISYTEKEIEALERQVHVLKNEEKINQRDWILEEKLQQKLSETNKTLKQLNKKVGSKVLLKENPQTSPKAPLTKLERIKNNLKVIESKLKEI